MAQTPDPRPTACLALADGTLFFGYGFGATGTTVAELCFNTAMTGYQEIMTDPSYAGQIVTFTFPHIGNTGTNVEDDETADPVADGMVVKWDPTEPSNWRSTERLADWLARHGRIAIGGLDTRRLTRAIRQQGAPHVALQHNPDGEFDIDALVASARGFVGLTGLDLAKDVTCAQSYHWNEMRWAWPDGYKPQTNAKHKVVAIVEEIEEVTEFYRMAGDYDYLLKVQVEDMNAYDRVYKRLVNTIDELSDVSARFAMERIKTTTALPL